MNTIMKNLSKAIGVVLYFGILSFAYTKMSIDRLEGDIRVFSGMFLIIGLILFEKAYREEKGNLAITGIEFLALSMHSLSIMHTIALLKIDFNTYMLISLSVAGIYYVLKGIICYTLEKRKYLKGLSDISEIVKEDEPIKREAKKRNVENKKEGKEND